jgi:hypothetical protein
VLVRGEFGESAGRVTFAADGEELHVILAEDVRTERGPVEVRGQLIDVGRLEPGDSRIAAVTSERDAERWPKPGEELLLQVTGMVAADPAARATVRALALEPWKFDGQSVTVVGQFRGRNILGDLPSSPAKGRYDFVLRSAEGAVWVTGLRPRGRGFELAVDARVDTGRWIEVTGTVSHERGLVMIAGTAISLATAPEATDAPEESSTTPTPPQPLEVVFSSPTSSEVAVSPESRVRVQFSRGANPSSLPGQVRVTYLGAEPGTAGPEFTQSYDPATRALELRFAAPLDRLRTVRVDLLDGIKAFDGGAFAPWSLTFSVGD